MRSYVHALQTANFHVMVEECSNGLVRVVLKPKVPNTERHFSAVYLSDWAEQNMLHSPFPVGTEKLSVAWRAHLPFEQIAPDCKVITDEKKG